MKLSVLHLVRTLDPATGGPIEFVKRICEAQTYHGVDSKIISLDSGKETWCQKPDVSVLAAGPGLGKYGYNRKFRELLRHEMHLFDLMIVHGLWQYHGSCALDVARELGKPYHVFPHGMLDPWFKRKFPIKHSKKQIYWVLKERSILVNAKTVLFTSDREQGQACATYWPRVSYRSRVVPLGVTPPARDLELLRQRFLNRFPGLRNGRFLLFLGRLAPKKGCDLLIRAMTQIGPPLRLVVAGPDSTPAYGRYLRRLAKGLPVTFTGLLESELKWGALAAADALILPSHQENFGLVVAEALAAGLPVLTSDQVNTSPLIESYGAGLVEADTFAGTGRLIERWLTADRHSFSLAAKTCFRDHFDIETTSERLLELLIDTKR